MDRARELEAVRATVREILDAKHEARERTLAACRRTIQLCAAAIRATQREDYPTAERLIGDAAAELAGADAAVGDHPDVRHGGYLHDAKKEFAEANITLAFVRGDAMPTAAQIGVETPAYLNGMAEAASELRRHALDCLRADRLARAEDLLGVMDEVYALLVTVDYPDAVTGGLRRTTDALRAVIERTRGDVTNALVAERLRRAVERNPRV